MLFLKIGNNKQKKKETKEGAGNEKYNECKKAKV